MLNMLNGQCDVSFPDNIYEETQNERLSEEKIYLTQAVNGHTKETPNI